MQFFEAWANLFLFFVYETRFFFVCFCFVKLRQTAEIVMIWLVPRCLLLCQNMHLRPADNWIKRDWKASRPMLSWKINYLPRKELFWVLLFRYLLFMNSCHKSLIICDTRDSLTISFFWNFVCFLQLKVTCNDK